MIHYMHIGDDYWDIVITDVNYVDNFGMFVFDQYLKCNESYMMIPKLYPWNE